MDLSLRRVVVHAPWQILDQIAERRLSRTGSADELEVWTYRTAGAHAIDNNTTVLADEALDGRSYHLGTSSCVRPGKG
jgi:hypothetical protein